MLSGAGAGRFFGMLRGLRGERGLPRGARHWPMALLRLAARRRRAAGFYDCRTLALFRRAWLRSGSASALMEYLLFRRDLGFALPARRVGSVREALPRLGMRHRNLAEGLIVEAGADRRASSSADIEALYARQDAWRADFAQLLRERVGDGICVVGNAAWLNGSRLGATIDSHGLVIRFNRFAGPGSDPQDIGSRLDVWVAAPGFEGSPPNGVRWVVVSGPDMRFRRRNWDSLRPAFDAGAAVLSVPLAPWRLLAARLQAPPSAGLLCLAWIHSILGSWEGIRAVGFGARVGGGYHHADPRHRAVDRHNWEQERALLEQWRGEGLAIEAGR